MFNSSFINRSDVKDATKHAPIRWKSAGKLKLSDSRATCYVLSKLIRAKMENRINVGIMWKIVNTFVGGKLFHFFLYDEIMSYRT